MHQLGKLLSCCSVWLVTTTLLAQTQTPAPGIITTIAGSGSYKSSGDGGPALKAGFSATSIVSDGTGNLYLSDEDNLEGNEVRRIDASSRIITNVAGNGSFSGAGSLVPRGLTLDSSGNIMVLASDANLSECYIVEVTPATGATSSFQDETCPETTVGSSANPNGSQAYPYYNSIGSDSSGNVYWTKLVPLSTDPYGRGEIQYTTLLYSKAESTGTVTLIAGNPNSILVSGDGKAASQAGLGEVSQISVSASGDVYLVSPGPSIRMISASTGIINTIAGGGASTSPTYQGAPTGFSTGTINAIAIDSANHLFIADNEPGANGAAATNVIRLLNLASNYISTIAGGSYSASTAGNGDGGPATSAILNTNAGLTTDSQGNVYDDEGSYIRVIGTPAAAAAPSTAASQPQISSVSPSEGGPGGMVTITGTGFGATQGSSTVDFEGQPAPEITNVNWGNLKITFMIPQAQVNYPINGLVSVVNSVGASNAVAFTILPSGPGVSAIIPDPGAVGTQVTIYGSNFGSSQGQSTVTFAGIQATPSSWSPSMIVVTVPQGATTGNVVITVAGNASSGFLYLLSGSCRPPS